MDSINLIFKNGHFYNKDTKQRILFREGEEYHVVASSDDGFEKASSAGRSNIKITTQEGLLRELAQKEKKKIPFKKLLDKNTCLYFSVDFSEEIYEFKARLETDLYLYKSASNSKKDYILHDCYCKTIESTTRNIQFFEEIEGKSLNDLYKCTYVHYFGNKGNPAENALIAFLLEDRKTTIDDLRQKALEKIKK